MTDKLSENSIAAWTSLIRASERALANIEDALAAKNLPTLSWYDALLEIERAGSEGIRPYELKARLLLPQYGTSRLLNRIVEAGYIRRLSCTQDGRGHIVQITEKGKAIRQKMWPVYAQCLKDIIEDRLDRSEADLMRVLLDRTGPDAPSTPT